MTNLLGTILISIATNSSYVTLQTTNGPVQMERLVVVQREMRFVEVLSESFRGMVLLPKVDKMTNSVPTNRVKTVKMK
jgi:hypothetical protein